MMTCAFSVYAGIWLIVKNKILLLNLYVFFGDVSVSSTKFVKRYILKLVKIGRNFF